MHIRRGDLSIHPHWASLGRWVPDSYYERVLPMLARSINASGGGRRATFHIFSEGSEAWRPVQARWAALLAAAGADVSWHIDNEIFSTLMSMIEADVLIGSTSDFSNVAVDYNFGLTTKSRLFETGQATVRLPRFPRCSCMNPELEAYARQLPRHTLNWRHGDALAQPRVLNDASALAARCSLHCSSETKASGGPWVRNNGFHDDSIDSYDNELACDLATLFTWKASQRAKGAARWASTWSLLVRSGAASGIGSQCYAKAECEG